MFDSNITNIPFKDWVLDAVEHYLVEEVGYIYLGTYLIGKLKDDYYLITDQ